MGEAEVEQESTSEGHRDFTRALVRDLAALERALKSGVFETGVRRVGAEQELFLVDADTNPSRAGPEILAAGSDPRIVSELARFNLEINLTPRDLGATAFRDLEAELLETLDAVRKLGARFGARPFLGGILPTLRQSDLTIESMSPVPRYHALNEAVRRIHGGAMQCHIKGIDEVHVTSDSVMLEAVNTSFQVHYQVAPDEFASVYNAAQLAAAPVLAAAVNSPVLFGKRLWAETRVAVFQHSIDARTAGQQARGHRSRVDFGDRWIQSTVLELFREDVSRFRVLLTGDVDDDPFAALARGVAPSLKALRLFNGTIYRWNRPCYGVVGGRAHLRIEARALPSGPTVLDEVANAAFLAGLLATLPQQYPRLTEILPFEDARANFFAAARFGLDAQMRWPDLGIVPVQRLILDVLAPLARQGLLTHGVDAGDVDRYLGVVEERVRTGRTGAAWTEASLVQLTQRGVPPEQRGHVLASSALAQQETGLAVHDWKLAEPEGDRSLRAPYRTVGQFMTTDLRTVRPDDLVDLAAALMDWAHVRHVPVEDDAGRIVGIVSHRAMVRLVARGGIPEAPIIVSSIMNSDVVTVAPETRTLDAMRLMRDRKVGCLPVVDRGKLVGIVTEHDLIGVAQVLLEEHLKDS